MQDLNIGYTCTPRRHRATPEVSRAEAEVALVFTEESLER